MRPAWATRLGSPGLSRNLSLAVYAVPAALLLIAAFWFLIVHPAAEAAHISSGYVAKTICSCVFVDQRDLDACRADLAPGYQSIGIALDPDNLSVRAHAGVMSKDSAHFDPRYGCRLDER